MLAERVSGATAFSAGLFMGTALTCFITGAAFDATGFLTGIELFFGAVLVAICSPFL